MFRGLGPSLIGHNVLVSPLDRHEQMNLGPLWRLVRLEAVAQSAQRVVEAWKAHAEELPAAIAGLESDLERLQEAERG